MIASSSPMMSSTHEKFKFAPKIQTRNSPGKAAAATPRRRQKSVSSMPTSPQVSSTTPKQPAFTPSGKGFYAGAKFEVHPSSKGLPAPPSHWTTQIPRSQSQPASPILIPSDNRTHLDLASLFGSPTVSVAQSCPCISLMNQASKTDSHKTSVITTSRDQSIQGSDASKVTSGFTKKEESQKRTMVIDLKKVLDNIAVASETTPTKVVRCEGFSPSCKATVAHEDNFKEMSDQLKSLMKVSVTA